MTVRAGRPGPRALRATLAFCRDDPARCEDALAWYDDGLLVLDGEWISQAGPADALLRDWPVDAPVSDLRGRLILPGFIDSHIHYPQTDIIGAPGGPLLSWLRDYTFPAEQHFADPQHAREVAGFFLDELLRNGTTTALVLGTVHPQSVEVLFEAAELRQLRMLAGKVLMDRHAPAGLLDPEGDGCAQSRALIERWHGQARLAYALTPRFAPTSTPRQLQRIGELARAYPDVYIHSHLAENRDEVAWVARLFPASRSYLDVYDRQGLLRERSVYAHGLYLDDADRRRLAGSGAALAFCPTSNLFLGSGLFDLAAADAAGLRVGLATDVGAGTSFSLLRTLSDACKVLQLQGQTLTPERSLYLVTLGAARALYLDDRLGSLLPGREADFVVLDPGCTPLLRRRLALARTPAERLSALIHLGDDRLIEQTWINGRCLYRRPALPGD